MLKHVIDIGWTSVCPSVTRWHPIKTAEYILMLSSPHDSPFILVLCSGVVMGWGPTGRSPRAAMLGGGTLRELSKIMLCKRNKINSVLATIHFISATDVRRCGATSLLKCFRNKDARAARLAATIFHIFHIFLY